MPVSRFWNPPSLPPPASCYSQAVLTTGATRWLHLSGQLGVGRDGTLADGLAAQIDQALANIDAALADANMARTDLVKLTFYLTKADAASIATYRARRDVFIGTATPPTATLLIVAGLAAPGYLAEIDAVAAA